MTNTLQITNSTKQLLAITNTMQTTINDKYLLVIGKQPHAMSRV